MLLSLVRVLFMLLAALLGGVIAAASGEPSMVGALMGAAVALLAVALEVGVARRYATYVPTLILGLALGFVAAQLAQPLFLHLPWVRDLNPDAQGLVSFFLIFIFSYLAVAVIVQTKDEFKFSVPYVQFRREGRGRRPLIVDTSALIDGRFVDLAASRLLDAPIVLPRPVLLELQGVADSSDRLRRNRGRAGLEGLQRLQADPRLEVRLDESPRTAETVDQHLVDLARRLDGRLVTTDYNLQKVAQVEGVEVVNVNTLAGFLRPALLSGEQFEIKLVRKGEEAGQAVGFLEDGTMVVVEGGGEKVGQAVVAVVTNVLQTSAGRLVFAKPAY